MSFEARDTSTQETVDKLDSAEEVTYRRNRNLPGVQLEVIVTRIVDGHKQSFQVPANKVDAGWPGSAKTLRAHLYDAFDNAE